MSDCEQQRLLQDILLQLGQIDGRLAGIGARQQELTGWLEKMDVRLRLVESRSAVFGLLSGGAASLLITLAAQYFRVRLGG